MWQTAQVTAINIFLPWILTSRVNIKMRWIRVHTLMHVRHRLWRVQEAYLTCNSYVHHGFIKTQVAAHYNRPFGNSLHSVVAIFSSSICHPEPFIIS